MLRIAGIVSSCYARVGLRQHVPATKMIKKLTITNYKLFQTFSLACKPGLNIIVGDNESGKSTILEAIHLALTKKLNGRFVDSELTPYLFNKQVVETYLEAIQQGGNHELPKITIEAYLDDIPELQTLRGSNNLDGVDAVGVKVEIMFDDDYRAEYEKLLEGDRADIKGIPVEYYRASWYSFAHQQVTARSLKVGVSFIDATTIRLQSGTDHYLHNIINDGLDVKERVGLALAYRRLKERFSEEPAIQEINSKLTARGDAITDKDLAVAIDLSQRGTWETSLTPHLNDIPFQHIGKGDQNALKIMLALDRQAGDSHVVLIEEPENHLSFSTMNALLTKIESKCEGKQIFATTHSAYVLNKLGIDKLVLLHDKKPAFLTALPADTRDYFRKLSGYDTLRLVLAKRTILVEGPSDELIVQKAYVLRHAKLPIQDRVDVLNVRGLSFARFLDIAKELAVETSVVTDNDGNHATKVVAKYAPYLIQPTTIKVFADTNDALPSLEEQIVACNELAALNAILGTTCADAAALLAHMKENKTECALRIFSTESPVTMPAYVWNAVA